MGSTMPERTPKGPALGHPLCPQGQGDDGTLREVLDGDAQGQRQGSRRRDLGAAGEVSGIHHPHGHALRDIVEGDGQHHHGGPLQLAFGPLHLTAFGVEVGDDVVQGQQE